MCSAAIDSPARGMSSRPFLLLSLPNSGSDWLASCIVAATGWRYYRKEFFNPLTNPDCADELLKAFGCELVTGSEHLCTCDRAAVSAAVQATWPRDTFDFNKEVWSFAKLPALVEHFNCMVLTRSGASLFPPSRLRVWQWYDAIWHQLPRNGRPLFAVSPRTRAVEGHAVARDMLLRDALAYEVPCLDYERIVQANPHEIAQTAK